MTLADVLTILATRGLLPARRPKTIARSNISPGPGPSGRGRLSAGRLSAGSHLGAGAGHPLRHPGDAGAGHQCGDTAQYPQQSAGALAAGRDARARHSPGPRAARRRTAPPPPASADQAGVAALRPQAAAVAGLGPGRLADVPGRRVAPPQHDRVLYAALRVLPGEYRPTSAGIPAWDDLLTVARLRAYVRWQGRARGKASPCRRTRW